MCGISGVISLSADSQSDSFVVPAEKVIAMNRLLFHRGPDSDGIFNKNPIVFGFRRLSIIDLHEEANQPMISSDQSRIIIFNGEIYNYKTLRHDLLKKGHIFKTQSDTEVILNAYAEYGENCVSHFNGMWAFAIYDFPNKKLFCSRDRLGVKPFYFVRNKEHLFFSSELKALHAACNLREANLKKVYEYLAYGYKSNDGDTFFSGCNELLPGHNLIIENNVVEQKKYWTLKPNGWIKTKSSYQEEYESLLKDAVALRYRSDVPVGLLLSGGLDSTSIARVTDELIESGVIEQNQIQAFVASFPGYEYDEASIAERFVQTCKHIKLNKIQVDTAKLIDRFDEIIFGFDCPVGGFSSVVHTSIMKECHDRGIKVVLNGQGSDEALAGYDRYIAGIHLLDQLIGNKKEFLKEFSAFNRLNGFSKPFLIGQMLKGVVSSNLASFLRAKYQEKIISCLSPEFVKSNEGNYESHYEFSWSSNNLNNYLLSQIKFQGLNQILHYEDISSMLNSVEVRSPFVDYRLMEFAFSIPNDMKLHRGVTKRIQRESIGKRLPQEIVSNRAKIGFRAPLSEYIKSNTDMGIYLNNMFSSESFKNKRIWNSRFIEDKFRNSEAYAQFPFWRVINLEAWSRLYQITNL